MQSTQDPLAAATVVILDKLHACARGGAERTMIETFKKETSCVTKNLWLNDKNVAYRGMSYFHFDQLCAAVTAIPDGRYRL